MSGGIQQSTTKLQHHYNNGQQQVVQNFTNKDFKEFYWNKDQFQSQSLMVFKKRALGFSANISWLFSKALFAYTAACIYSEKRKEKKTYTTGHFGTINSYIGTPVLAYRYSQTVRSLSEQNVLTDTRSWMDFDRGVIQ